MFRYRQFEIRQCQTSTNSLAQFPKKTPPPKGWRGHYVGVSNYSFAARTKLARAVRMIAIATDTANKRAASWPPYCSRPLATKEFRIDIDNNPFNWMGIDDFCLRTPVFAALAFTISMLRGNQGRYYPQKGVNNWVIWVKSLPHKMPAELTTESSKPGSAKLKPAPFF